MESRDYTIAFSNLKSANPMIARQKAILLLAIMDLVAQEIIDSNEILYNEDLKKAYRMNWDKFIGPGSYDSHSVVKAFWYMYGEAFWHIIPKPNSTNVLGLMADSAIRPSKSVIEDSVKCAMLDLDLYILLTLPSSRKELKRTLILSYTNLDEDEIERNVEENYEVEVNSDPSELFNSLKETKEDMPGSSYNVKESTSLVYDALSLDEKIELNISYFTFLKQHQIERPSFLQHFPSVQHLCEAIYNGAISRESSSASFVSIYLDFLYNLKYSLMSLPNGSKLIDIIIEVTNKLGNLEQARQPIEEFALDDSVQKDETITSDEDEKQISEHAHRNLSSSWTEREESIALISYADGEKIEDIASKLGQSIATVESFIDSHQEELEKLERKRNLLSDRVPSENQQDEATETQVTDQEKQLELRVENHNNRCRLYDESGLMVYSSSGSVSIFHGEPYRISMTYSSLSINRIELGEGGCYHTGLRIIRASAKTELYRCLSNINDLGLLIDDIRQNDSNNEWEVLVNHYWYGENGDVLEYTDGGKESECVEEDEVSQETSAKQEGISMDILENYSPKGKIKHIRENAMTPYDYLLMLAITDFIHFEKPQTFISFDELSSMMIANAWEIEEFQPNIRGKDALLDQCIDYLIDESKNNMQFPLNLESSKELIFQQIKDYPMNGPYEDTVDKLVEKAPFEIANIWIKANDLMELVSVSQTFEKRNLYAIYYSTKIPSIQINPKWIGNLHYDYDNLQAYFQALYVGYLQSHEKAISPS